MYTIVAHRRLPHKCALHHSHIHRRAGLALDDLRQIPIQLVEHTLLLGRCWELPENLTIYDAAYVALAEALQATLLTGDRRLARAPGVQCPIEVLTTTR